MTSTRVGGALLHPATNPSNTSAALPGRMVTLLIPVIRRSPGVHLASMQLKAQMLSGG
jgi:hypothetical protein